MLARDFAYWLQGFFEINKAGGMSVGLNIGQVTCIENHLNMVFKHEIDPSHGDAAHQAELSKVHQGGGAVGQAHFPGRPTIRC